MITWIYLDDIKSKIVTLQNITKNIEDEKIRFNNYLNRKHCYTFYRC